MRIFSRILFQLSALVLFAACNAPQDPVLSVGDFAPYVAKFEALSTQYSPSAIQVTNLIIQYGDLQSAQERAICTIDGNNTPTITVRQDTWQTMSEPEREELIFHEMGHCVLRRGHIATITAQGLPASMMNPYLISGPIYASYQAYYLNELFNPGK